MPVGLLAGYCMPVNNGLELKVLEFQFFIFIFRAAVRALIRELRNWGETLHFVLKII